MLSTITSPVFFKITVFYWEYDFYGLEPWGSDGAPFRELSPAERAAEISRHRTRFEVFREAYKVRAFRLELCASVLGSVGEDAVRILEEAVAEEKAARGYQNLLFDPRVTYNPQRTRSGDREEWCAPGKGSSSTLSSR